MQLRFPQIEWLPYDPQVRERAIACCDAWLGLGDTPFQTVLGDWMLDHLLQEAEWCRRFGKPMYYLGVGGDAAEFSSHPKVRTLAGQAAHIWTRDRRSAQLLQRSAPRAFIDVGADLAHLWLADFVFPRPTTGAIGLVLNFEERWQATPAQLDQLVRTLARDWQVRWLAQEVRSLNESEVSLYAALTDAAREVAPLRMPDYANAPDVSALLAAWDAPEWLLTSRYHAALIGAWAGWVTAVFPRSAKVRSAVDELGLATINSFADSASAVQVLASATPASRATLEAQAALAREACDACLAVLRC